MGKIVFVEKDGSASEGLELFGATDVIDVRVGDKNLLESEAECGEAAMDAETSSPGSMTMASRVSSSARIVQLHWRGPTGKISRIMDTL